MSEVADWSCVPNDIYVVGVSTLDGVVYDVRCCSVPYALAPEIRYTRAGTPQARLWRRALREDIGSARELFPLEAPGDLSLETKISLQAGVLVISPSLSWKPILEPFKPDYPKFEPL